MIKRVAKKGINSGREFWSLNFGRVALKKRRKVWQLEKKCVPLQPENAVEQMTL